MKILVSDKITAYHNYSKSHKLLFTAHTPVEQFLAVKNTVENYINNHNIYLELNYYKKHKQLLGEHQVFQTRKLINELMKLRTEELVIRKDNLKKYILRVSKQITANDKPHLLKKRADILKCYQLELSEVEKILLTR